jgi:hypothetical protein
MNLDPSAFARSLAPELWPDYRRTGNCFLRVRQVRGFVSRPNAVGSDFEETAMLAPPNRIRCIECGLAYGEPGFSLHGGRIESGPAYFTDRGALCSPQCSLAHYRKRAAEGTMPAAPPPNPYER